MNDLKIIFVAGARPNFMKIASLVKTILEYNKTVREKNQKIRFLIVHTGQHYDKKMSEVFFNELEIPAPDINLEVGSASHAQQTAKIMMAFEPVCLKEKPDWVVVVGDVNSTMACTLVASKLGIKIAHVEAGLRSFDRTMPEEINRVVTDALADLLLTPSLDADENLKREGVPSSKIRLVGNIMIDALVANIECADRSYFLSQLCIEPKGFVYVTLHRPSNVDDPGKLEAIMSELNLLANSMPVVFPMHPRTRKMIELHQIQVENNSRIKLLEPVGYHDSICLAKNARFVLTDSGGLQEETTYLQTPCLTLRPNTERSITIDIGTNKLTTIDDLSADIQEIIGNRKSHGEIPLYWDGFTSRRILNALMESR